MSKPCLKELDHIQSEVKANLEKSGFVSDTQSGQSKYYRKWNWGNEYCFLPQVHFQAAHNRFNLAIEGIILSNLSGKSGVIWLT